MLLYDPLLTQTVFDLTGNKERETSTSLILSTNKCFMCHVRLRHAANVKEKKKSYCFNIRPKLVIVQYHSSTQGAVMSTRRRELVFTSTNPVPRLRQGCQYFSIFQRNNFHKASITLHHMISDVGTGEFFLHVHAISMILDRYLIPELCLIVTEPFWSFLWLK